MRRQTTQHKRRTVIVLHKEEKEHLLFEVIKGNLRELKHKKGFCTEP